MSNSMKWIQGWFRQGALLLLAATTFGACDGNQGQPTGTLGYPCHPDGTCNAPWECVFGVCQSSSPVDAGLDSTAAPDGAESDATVPCGPGWCELTCAEAALAGSHFGCEFWPTPTANPQLAVAFDHNFGVQIFNPNSVAAQATLTLDGSMMAQVTVPAGQIQSFELPLDTGLKLDASAEESRKVAGAAYHLTTDLPVSAYQFNPLDYAIAGEYSYSNDAALLLPAPALGTDHLMMARQTFGVDSSGTGTSYVFIPGFFTVVGTSASTTVTVTFSAHTQAGPGIAAQSPGSVQTFTLGVGEALQIVSALPLSCTGSTTSDDCDGQGGTCWYCDMGPDWDLTGTRVESSHPVAVFSGHACSFVPVDTWACDHLEAQVPPTEAWGRSVVVARTEPQDDSGIGEPNVVRVISGVEGNTITFFPAQALGAQLTLGRGQWVELESTEDFQVSATGRVQVAQFLVGQGAYSSQLDSWGDPSLGILPPVEQFQTYYAFLAPGSFSHHYVTVVAPVGAGSAPIYLDGQILSEGLFSEPIGTSGHGAARIPIDGGEHVITSAAPFGISVYGFASYTSYLYPGGQGLRALPP